MTPSDRFPAMLSVPAALQATGTDAAATVLAAAKAKITDQRANNGSASGREAVRQAATWTLTRPRNPRYFRGFIAQARKLQ
jgi:hypothetical protein